MVDPKGKLFAKFGPHEYLDHIGEHVEPWSYMKFTFLRKIGWKGFRDKTESGIYCVAPLARLNASTGLTTPLAQAEHDRMYDVLGGKPSGCTLAFHWARFIVALYAAERLQELVSDRSVTGTDLRNIPQHGVVAGVGIVEAPRGTLIHHYEADANGLTKKVNLIVATQNNAARIALSVDKAAKAMVREGRADQGVLNLVEMAIRAYDLAWPAPPTRRPNIPGRERARGRRHFETAARAGLGLDGNEPCKSARSHWCWGLATSWRAMMRWGWPWFAGWPVSVCARTSKSRKPANRSWCCSTTWTNTRASWWWMPCSATRHGWATCNGTAP